MFPNLLCLITQTLRSQNTGLLVVKRDSKVVRLCGALSDLCFWWRFRAGTELRCHMPRLPGYFPWCTGPSNPPLPPPLATALWVGGAVRVGLLLLLLPWSVYVTAILHPPRKKDPSLWGFFFFSVGFFPLTVLNLDGVWSSLDLGYAHGMVHWLIENVPTEIQTS